MQIICISRGSFGYGTELATQVAAKLGYPCVSREQLTDQATEAGIPVGKLEMAIFKRHALTESLAIEADRFKAFITARLCELALDGGVVYHGRTGHLVLQGVSDVLRVRAIADPEERIAMVIKRLNLTRKQAKAYNEQVDEDRRRWVHAMYNVEWDNPTLYDFTINSARLSLENSASALMQMAQLPDFQITPASRKVLQDLLLAAQCRLALGSDERTRGIKAAVQAEQGQVTVTYPPWQSAKAAQISAVLQEVDGVRSVACTLATSSILCIEEQFDPQSEAFGHLIEIAAKWNAAVELVRIADPLPEDAAAPQPDDSVPQSNTQENGGILDDAPERPEKEDKSRVQEAIGRLVEAGRVGAAKTIYGGPSAVLESLNRGENYNLVVVGEVFLDRGAETRKRLKRDFIGQLADHLRLPVIASDELKTQYLFGLRQWLQLLGFGVVAVLIYLGVFTHQERVLSFLIEGGTHHRVLATAAVVLFVPTIAYVVGSFAHNVLKLVKLE